MSKLQSQYANTPVTEWHLGYWQGQSVPSSDSDEIFTITSAYNGRPDILSYERYGTAKYWWVFAIRNPDTLVDPINDFTEGKEIYVPRSPK